MIRRVLINLLVDVEIAIFVWCTLCWYRIWEKYISRWVCRFNDCVNSCISYGYFAWLYVYYFNVRLNPFWIHIILPIGTSIAASYLFHHFSA